MSMREKIARVLDPDAWEKNLFNNANAMRQKRALAKADAVLDALMEPTEDMAKAGYTQITTRSNSDHSDMPNVFRAMIQAAKEGK